MPGSRARGLLAAPALAVMLAVAGCGGSDAGDGGIPQETADRMLEMTQEIEDATLPEDCATAQETTTALRGEAEAVQVTQTREALDAMITRLDENIDSDCEGGTSPPPEEEEPEEPVEPAPEEEPVEPAPVPEEEPEEPVEPPPEEEPQEEVPTEEPPSGGDGPNGPPQTPPGQEGGGPPSGGIEERGAPKKEKPNKPGGKLKKEKG